MEFLKKVNALVLGLAVLLAVSCGKEEVADPVSQDPNIVNPECKITEWKQHYDSAALSSIHHYDGQGRVSEIVTTMGNSIRSHIKFEYNTAGKISKASWLDNNVVQDYILYDYSADGLRIKESTYYKSVPTAPFSLFVMFTNEYNGAKKLIKRNRFENYDLTTPITFWTFTYQLPNKVITDTY